MKECIPEGKPTEVPSLKYNYVFLFAREGFLQTMFGKAFYRGAQTRVYRQAFRGGRLSQKLFRLHWAFRVNEILPLPFKSLWFSRIYKQDFSVKRPLCFVYLGGNSIRYDGGLTNYIRKASPENRQVMLHLDLISKKCHYDYEIIQRKVDAAVTYDKAEAQKYGIHWYPGRFYQRTLPLTEPKDFDTDVYFLGNAKDRLPLIMGVYQKLQAKGLRCKFLLTGVPKESQTPLEGVHYIDGISYEENLKHVQASKCILEIGQRGSNAPTLRHSEAITYHRFLLSNCTDIKSSEYYIPETMSFFDSLDDIDLELIEQDIPYEVFHQRNIDFSMDRFLQFLEQILEEKE